MKRFLKYGLLTVLFTAILTIGLMIFFIFPLNQIDFDFNADGWMPDKDLVQTFSEPAHNTPKTSDPTLLPPTIALTTDSTQIDHNTATTLRWTVSGDVTTCTASGAWNGSKNIVGDSISTGKLTSKKTYRLQCTGPGGSSPIQSVTIGVNPLTPPPTAIARSCDLYIATNGSDTANGTSIDTPFATLERARDAIRAIKTNTGLPGGGLQVCLREGVHSRQSTFKLYAEDSGTAAKPIIYRSFPGETARITGALQLPGDQFKNVTDVRISSRLDPAAQGKVMQIDLSKYTTNYGTLVSRGSGGDGLRVGALELFIESERMELARWPDAEESFPFVETVNAISAENKFTYTGNRPERWTQAEEIWLHGFWKFFYSDKHVKVTNLDTAAKTMTFEDPRGAYYGLNESGGRPYYAKNLLEEITVPGEWYLNRNTGILYLWPKQILKADTEVMVSQSEETLVRTRNTSHVIFHGLIFEINRTELLEVIGGDHVVAQYCTFRHGATEGIVITDGSNNGIERSEIHDIGNAGLTFQGGDRLNLVKSNNFIRNSHLYNVGYWVWTYSGGILLKEAVGVNISHNHIHHSNGQLIGVSGNDNIIEYNDIHDAVLWAGDAGAIYAYLWWDYRGNHIKYNFIHDIRTGFRSDSGESGVYDANGIYLDGSVPGFTVFGNILHNVQNRAIFANGGRDTVIQNNIVTNSGEIGIYGTTGGFRMTSEIMQRLIAMNYQQDPWASAYPKLAAIPSDWPDGSHWRYPAGTIVKNNIGFGNTRFLAEGNYDGTGVFNKYEEMSNNIKSTTPLYVNEAAGNFNLRKNSPAFKIPGFVDIPFDRIGIEPDNATPSKFSTLPPRKPTY